MIASPFVGKARKTAEVIHPVSIRFQAAISPYGPQVHVDFSGVVGGLQIAALGRGFELSRANGRPFPAIHRMEAAGFRVILHLTTVPPRGAKLRYGVGLDPTCTLRDSRGMAVSVFGPLPISGLGHS
jgi:hypothetical protein